MDSGFWMRSFMTGQFLATWCPRTMSAACCRWAAGHVSRVLCHVSRVCVMQVGSWSAMTGYGLAFPHNSKHRARFNDMLLEYKVELETKVRC